MSITLEKSFTIISFVRKIHQYHIVRGEYFVTDKRAKLKYQKLVVFKRIFGVLARFDKSEK